jgi:hypothetical protein
MQMYAQTTDQGTAAAETALCGACLANAEAKAMTHAAAHLMGGDDIVGPYVKATGNDALTCQWCGLTNDLTIRDAH